MQRPKSSTFLSLLVALSMALSAIIPVSAATDSDTIPQLLYPKDWAVFSTGESPLAVPILEWKAVVDATRYHVQVFNNQGTFDYYTNYTHLSLSRAGDMEDGEWTWKVRVDQPFTGEFSEARTFTKRWATPWNSPGPLTPGYKADVTGSLVFTWTPVRGATHYRIQISETPDFSGQLVLSEETPYTTFVPTKKFSNKTYYWQVTPLQRGHVGYPSQIEEFKYTFWPKIEPIEPASGVMVNSTPPFSWHPVAGVQKNHLMISTSPNFDGGGRLDFYTTQNAFQHPKLLELLGPEDGAEVVETMPVFEWTPVDGAVLYTVQISPDANFPPEDTDILGENDKPAMIPIGRLPAGLYYWRVISKDAYGQQIAESAPRRFFVSAQSNWSVNDSNAAFSEPAQFTATYASPDNLYVLHAADDKTYPHPPTLCWSSEVGENMTPWSYRVQVSLNESFSSIVEQVNTDFTCWQSTRRYADGTYYWRVFQRRGDNQLSQPSAAMDFHIAVPTVENMMEFPGANYISGVPLPGRTFKWDAVPGADHYILTVAADPGFTNLRERITVDIPLHTPTVRLWSEDGFDEWLYWRVAAVYKDNPNVQEEARAWTSEVSHPADRPVVEGETYTVASGDTLDVPADQGLLINDSDPMNYHIRAILAAHPEEGKLTLHSDGSFTYMSNGKYTKEDTFSYYVDNGLARSETVTVTLTVISSVIGKDDHYTTFAGDQLEVLASEGVLANDINETGVPLIASVVTHPSHGRLDLRRDGSFIYTSDEGFIGVDYFTYRPAGEDGTPGSQAAVSISVIPIIHPDGNSLFLPVVVR